MKPTTLLTLTSLLTPLTTASLVESVQSILSPHPSGPVAFAPLTAAQQIPCCTKPPCPGCPAIRENTTLALSSISFPSTGLRSLIRNPPGCGHGFDAADCLRFFQVMLATWETPLGISAKKAAGGDGEEGCGVESTPGECLRYVNRFLGEVRGPLGVTLGDGGVVDHTGETHGEGCEGGCEEGKDEL